MFPARKKENIGCKKRVPGSFFSHSQTAKRRRYKEITSGSVTASGPTLAVRHEVEPPCSRVWPTLTCAPVIYAAPVSGGLFEGPRRNESVNSERCRKVEPLPREL